jgi:hypothetical protein
MPTLPSSSSAAIWFRHLEDAVERIGRRSLLLKTAGAVAGAALGAAALPEAAAAYTQWAQGWWRFCGKCYGLVYTDSVALDTCPLGGKHNQVGWVFWLLANDRPVGGGETSEYQARWWRCGRCSGLFWITPATTDWFGGRCVGSRGRGHERIDINNNLSWQYLMRHDVGEPPYTQHQWRFCAKCTGMFYNGFPDKGFCPAGGGHAAAGFDFAIDVQYYNL